MPVPRHAAAEAGIAQRVWYANIEDGIVITDFIEAVPLSINEALIRIPRTLRKLHALPLFPKAFNFVTMHNTFIWRFQAADFLPRNEIAEVFQQYARIAAIYPRLPSDIVFYHDDLKPENILFDGHQLWLADWQAAFVNDHYFDLAIVANFVLNNHTDELTYLQKYFEQSPDDYQLRAILPRATRDAPDVCPC